MKQQLTRNFLEGSHRFAKTSLGYEASEPPRGVAWIALIRTQPKGTYNDYLTVTNRISFLGRATKKNGALFEDLNARLQGTCTDTEFS